MIWKIKQNFYGDLILIHSLIDACGRRVNSAILYHLYCQIKKKTVYKNTPKFPLNMSMNYSFVVTKVTMSHVFFKYG